MVAKARSQSWWQRTVSRWKSSGLTAREFAAREGLSAGTLLWWSSRLRRGTRAERGSVTSGAIAPIEIALARGARTSHVEVAIEGAVLRVEVGADVEYVATLVKHLRGAR